MAIHKAKMKGHIEAGLDITAPVTWINHLGQEVPATVIRIERQGASYPARWEVRDTSGGICSTGAGGSFFTFSY